MEPLPHGLTGGTGHLPPGFRVISQLRCIRAFTVLYGWHRKQVPTLHLRVQSPAHKPLCYSRVLNRLLLDLNQRPTDYPPMLFLF